jgi:hypothetical protein
MTEEAPVLDLWPDFEADHHRFDLSVSNQERLQTAHQHAGAYNRALGTARSVAVDLCAEEIAAAVSTIATDPDYLHWLSLENEVGGTRAPGGISWDFGLEKEWYRFIKRVIDSPGSGGSRSVSQGWLDNMNGHRPATFGWLLGDAPESAARQAFDDINRFPNAGIPPLEWHQAIFAKMWPRLVEHASFCAAQRAAEAFILSLGELEQTLEHWLLHGQERYEGGIPE